MPHEFKVSAFGLNLIKAYEGFRASETTLVSGQRVIGYGHRYTPDEEPLISRKKAEEILKEDLEPYEAMINESVYAPLTQSQFDALVSLSFNIGPRAFLSSSALHALNNGRLLDAAAGFDEWRKSVIEGETYVVDALVRRRTAEKALFLRTAKGVVAAPRHDIPPKRDESVNGRDEELPAYGRYDRAGVVARVPYDQQNKPDPDTGGRRKDDGSVSTLTLSEIAPSGEDEGITVSAEKSEHTSKTEPMPENEEGLSPIAVAAAEVSERLDRLIGERPEPAIETETEPDGILELQPGDRLDAVRPEPANDGTHDDYRRPGRERPTPLKTPDTYISQAEPEPEDDFANGTGAFWTTLLLGAMLLGGGAVRWFLNPADNVDELSAFLAPVATIVGGMIVLGAFYYLIKTMSRRA